MIRFSGCNYYINQGKNEYEPVGTATSMHECPDDCSPNCPLAKPREVWIYDDNWGKFAHEYVLSQRH